MEFNFDNEIKEYRKYMNETNIQDAYCRISEYFKSLHEHFKRKYNYGYKVSDIYENHIYSTYFYFTPNFFKYKGFFISFFFNYTMVNFEVKLKSKHYIVIFIIINISKKSSKINI